MKLSTLLAIGSASAALASPLISQAPLFKQPEVPEEERYLIELAGGEKRWIFEEEKWELRRVRICANIEYPHVD
jgi:leucyl aminopeptidase